MPPLLGAEKPVCKETLSAKPCQLLYESFPAALTVRNVNSRIVITPVQKAAMLECFDVFFSLNTSRQRDLICLLPAGLPHLAAEPPSTCVGCKRKVQCSTVSSQSFKQETHSSGFPGPPRRAGKSDPSDAAS